MKLLPFAVAAPFALAVAFTASASQPTRSTSTDSMADQAGRQSLELGDSLAVPRPYAESHPVTAIEASGRSMSSEELRQGQPVRASFDAGRQDAVEGSPTSVPPRALDRPAAEDARSSSSTWSTTEPFPADRGTLR